MTPTMTLRRSKAATNRHRLDPSIRPASYDIALQPDLPAFTFTGTETVALRATRPFDRITLHATELTLRRASVQRGGGEPIQARRISYDQTLQTATLWFGARLPAGSDWRLEIEFAGSINDKMHGFYRTSYEIDGNPRWGGATQFEATDARRAFPCWDEPAAKATFRLTLTVPKHFTALSNMPVEREEALGELKRLSYEPSPKMSTYLLAWVIAELESVQGRDANGVPIRVWTTIGKKAQGRFALDVAKRALPYFAKWFNIPYALPKLDMVALPDFASGAMENWGLVTYRETALLVDPENSSVQATQRVAEVIDHELAHQWFGNLVTMEWWTDLWLNEGFASYMGPKAVDDQFPEWRIWSQFVAGEYRAALRDDSLKSSHPIEIEVHDPHEIREIFDAITYSKGSSVNRMLELYLTEPVFRRGLSQYLKKYAYGNARTADLWAVLEAVSGKPVKAIMASFTTQEGYPVLQARRTGRGVELQQRRFLFDGSADRQRRQWKTPIVTIAQGLKRPAYDLITTGRTVLRVPGAGWVKINAGQGGFFRTAYEPALWTPLAAAVAEGALSPVDCLGLLDDAYALARAGVLRTSQALALIPALRGIADYNVWVTAAGVLRGVENIADPAARAPLQALMREAFRPLLERLGWDRRPSDGHLDALLRSLALASLGHAADAEVVDGCRLRFGRFARDGQLLPDIRGAVFATVAEHGGEPEYEALLNIYRATELQEERVRVLRALTGFAQPSLIRRALELAMSGDVRKQDAYILLGGFGGNPAGRPAAWEFVKSQWKTLADRFGDGGLNLMTRIIEGATGGFSTPEALRDVKAFFGTHPVAGAERTMKQCVEVIRANGRWARRDAADLRRWLGARSRASG